MAWVRRELNALGIPPLKRLGQHFLIDNMVREQLVAAAGLTASDTVVEVGPGLGFLTTLLAKKAARVLAVEKDRTLAAYLRKKFSQQQNVTIMEMDALSIKIPGGSKIVSSPPYNISSKLILLIMNSSFRAAALLLQEEFVSRLIACSGSREYGRISVMFQCKAKAELGMKVPRESFYPKPKVHSAVIKIAPIEEKPRINNDELFSDMVRALFTQRRRRLKGVLTRYLKTLHPDISGILRLEAALLDKRVYQLRPDELVALSNNITEAKSELERN